MKETLIDGMGQLIDMEERLMEHYNHALEQVHGNQQAEAVLTDARKRHLTSYQRLDARREQLQREAGEGLIGEVWESFVEALKDVAAGLPVLFITNESRESVKLLVDSEEKLAAFYTQLSDAADPASRQLFQEAVNGCRENTEALRALGTLG